MLVVICCEHISSDLVDLVICFILNYFSEVLLVHSHQLLLKVHDSLKLKELRHLFIRAFIRSRNLVDGPFQELGEHLLLERV